MADTIERIVETEKKLPPNLDWPSARLYYYMGLDVDLYTPLFVDQPRDRLGRPRDRATRQQPPDPPARQLHRARSAKIRAAGEAINSFDGFLIGNRGLVADGVDCSEDFREVDRFAARRGRRRLAGLPVEVSYDMAVVVE